MSGFSNFDRYIIGFVCGYIFHMVLVYWYEWYEYFTRSTSF